MSEQEQARLKLAEKFGDSTRTGGKGSVRRKKKVVTKTSIDDDKKFKQSIKKFGVQPIPGMEEVCLFKDDNTVIQFTRPSLEVMASLPNNTFVIMGKPETKNIRDMLPDIIQHLGPKQFDLLKEIMAQMQPKQGEKIQEQDNEDDDDVPELVNQNFEDVSKQVE